MGGTIWYLMVMDWPRFSRTVLLAPSLLIRAGRSTKNDRHSWGRDGRELGMHGFLLLERGSGRYRDAEGRQERVAAGTLIVLFPGLRHDYGPAAGEPWEESFLDCDSALLHQLERQGVLARGRPVVRPAATGLEPLRRLIADIEHGRTADPHEAHWRLHGAVLSAMRQDAAAGDDALALARTLLEDRPELPVDLHRIAGRAGMSWESFRKRFRERFGVPPSRYRQQVRCEAAARLLVGGAGAGTVEDVAERMGFCDGAHLRRHFRRIMGLSPEAFRRLHGGGG